MLLDTLNDKIKEFMKAHDTVGLTALRTLVSDIKNASIAAQKPVDDAMCIAVLDKAIKQKNETIEGYAKAGKTDRADEEKKTLELYKQYMPAQMSEDEVVAEIAKAIESTGACEQKDMGKVMKILTPIIKGRFDGKAASQLVIKALLAKAGK
jgi:uncharacterized protein YqeY